MTNLYVNSRGREVRSFSYSAGQLFHECAQKFKLARLDGWRERELRASMEFGKVLENAIQAYHLRQSVDEAIRVFYEGFGDREGWNAQKTKDLKYAPVERDWESLAASGEEMIKLYHLRLPLLPFDLSVPPEFQIKYYKEMFPGTDLAGIEFVAYIDMRVRSKLTLGDALGVDIKVMNKALDATPDIARLDQQLRTYAWVTGIPDWAFLNFIKCGREIEKGDRVTLLEDHPSGICAGTGMVVAAMDKGDDNAPGDLAYLVVSEVLVDEMNQAQGYKNGKLEQTNAAKERKLVWLKTYALRVPTNVLTKQRIQFVNTHIGLNEQLEASRQIGQDLAQIVYSNSENFWPLQGGIRFPNDKCVRCSMRGLCLQNKQLSDTLVVRSDEDWDAQKETHEEM